MKKIVFIVFVLLFGLIVGEKYTPDAKTDNMTAKIYYIDQSMQRLIPVEITVKNTSKEVLAENVVEKLIEGNDKNKKIMRIIPKNKSSINVNVIKNTAYVDLKKEFTDNLSDNRNHNILAVYQIVNSLSSIDGIDYVKFTFDGEVEKGFISKFDMREAFSANYYI